MGRHIICEGDTIYVYKLGEQESDLPLLHTVFGLGELEKDEHAYPVHVLHLSRNDMDELRAVLETDDIVAQRAFFKEMVQALIEWMEDTGEPSFAFLSEG